VADFSKNSPICKGAAQPTSDFETSPAYEIYDSNRIKIRRSLAWQTFFSEAGIFICWISRDVVSVMVEGRGRTPRNPTLTLKVRTPDMVRNDISFAWNHLISEKAPGCGWLFGEITLLWEELQPPSRSKTSPAYEN
jgi:hypothetical protein